MERSQRGGELLLVLGQVQGMGDRRWFPWIGPSVYFSHFSNQLIADLCEFFNLLILWRCTKGGGVRKERTEHMQKNAAVCNQVLSYGWVWSPCVAELVPETRSSSVPSSDWRSAPCSLSWLWIALERFPHWPFKTQAKGEMNSCYKSQM